jgi:hypothetical protein
MEDFMLHACLTYLNVVKLGFLYLWITYCLHCLRVAMPASLCPKAVFQGVNGIGGGGKEKCLGSAKCHVFVFTSRRGQNHNRCTCAPRPRSSSNWNEKKEIIRKVPFCSKTAFVQATVAFQITNQMRNDNSDS